MIVDKVNAHVSCRCYQGQLLRRLLTQWIFFGSSPPKNVLNCTFQLGQFVLHAFVISSDNFYVCLCATSFHVNFKSLHSVLDRWLPCLIRRLSLGNFFFWSAPVAFRRVALETPEWTSRDSNHHRQSVSAGKTNAIPTEPSGRLRLSLGNEQRNADCRMRQDLRRLGLTSLDCFFTVFGQPEQNIFDEAFNTWLRQDVNPAITLGDSAALKRLLFESHTLVMASLKEQVIAPDSAATKKVLPTERDARMQHVRNNLAGLLIESPLDPGYSLLDSCAQMHFFTNEIKYPAPERCVSRMHEVTHQKHPGKQVEIESDRLIIKERHEVPDETAHSALKVKEAFERRAALFGHMHRDPPSGYTRTSVSQLITADKAVWTKLLETGSNHKEIKQVSWLWILSS